MGNAIAQAVVSRPGTAVARVRSRGSVHVGFVVDIVALEQVFPPSTLVLPRQFHSTGAPLHVKNEKKLIIFIAGLQSRVRP
jgi:hypothetical protein